MKLHVCFLGTRCRHPHDGLVPPTCTTPATTTRQRDMNFEIIQYREKETGKNEKKPGMSRTQLVPAHCWRACNSIVTARRHLIGRHVRILNARHISWRVPHLFIVRSFAYFRPFSVSVDFLLV